jgi:transcriptional regulator with XRE-family HTH domain
MVSRIERGQIDKVPIGTLRAVAAVLGASLELKLRWHGEGLDRLLDEAHAQVVDATVVLLREAGWEAAVEVSSRSGVSAARSMFSRGTRRPAAC